MTHLSSGGFRELLMNKVGIAKFMTCVSLMLLQPSVFSADAATTKTTVGKVAAASTSEALDPEQYLQRAITEVERLAQAEIDKNAVPGLAISIVQGDKVVYAKGFGVREVGKPELVDADTVFQLASVSKCITSTVVAALVSEGKVKWESRISDLDPSFEMQDPWVTRELTVKDLLAHRSGLPEHAGDILEDIGYDRAQVLYRLRFQNPESSLRSKYDYTNFGFTEGAVAAAKPLGLSWEDVVTEKLFKPVGMNSSSSRFSEFMARSNKAVGHTPLNGGWVHKVQREPDAQAPAGGVSSSVNDLAKWMILQISGGNYGGKQIVGSAALADTHKPVMLTGFSPNGLPEFYGLGMNVSYDDHGRLRLGHSGAFCMGAGTTVGMVPSQKIGVCVLTNAYPIGLAEGLAKTFTDVYTDGKVSRDWISLFKKIFADPATLGVVKGYDYSRAPATVSPALGNRAYVGKYSNDLFGDIEVLEKDGGMYVAIGPQKRPFPLKHYDRDVFTWDIETENLTGVSGLRFNINSDGVSSGVLVENFNNTNQGLFKRL